MKAKMTLDHEPVADGGWLLRALLKIEGEVRPVADRTPLNLSLVLDRSGSMAGASLVAVKDAASMLVRRLAPTDTLSVIAYDGEVTVIAPPATGAEQPQLLAQIDAIYAGGCTNLSGGWLQGRKFVAANQVAGCVNRVLLLTDGLANHGIVEPAKLVGLCRKAEEAGITTTTIGFGSGYDEHLLTAMADAGGGGAYYIEQPDQAPAVFEEELRGLLSIAAQNVRVEITTAAGTEACRVLHSYPSLQAGGVLSLQVGDLYAREPRPILAEFLLKPPVDAEGPGSNEKNVEIPVGTFVIMADVLTAAGGVEEREIIVPVRLSPVEGGIAEPEVRRELTLLDAVRERERAVAARTEAERSAARESLSRVSDRLRALDPGDGRLCEEATDLDRVAASMVVAELGAVDRKYNSYRARFTGRGRTEAVESVSREKWEERRRRNSP